MFRKRKTDPVPPPPAPAPGTVEYQPMPSFEEAAKCGSGYADASILADLKTSWFYQGEPRLTELPDFFGPFFTAVALAAEWSKGRPLRVLDFGGATGRYGDYAKTLYPNVAFDWAVVETPLYADYAKATGLAATLYTSLDDVPGSVDLILFSGVLQYIPDLRAVLSHRIVRQAETVFITRTPTAEAEQAFVQRVHYANGPVEHAARIISQPELSGILSESHKPVVSWRLHHHLGVMGVVAAPSMIWRRTTSCA
jgi:putative methyltransferase (TIGR04325 family)